jgi:homoserine kinase type II
MAVYTQIDDAELSAFLSEYDLGCPRAFKGIAEGVENSNFLLETDAGRYIMTIFEKRAKREDLPFFMGMMGHLAHKGFPAPEPVVARDGEALRTIGGKTAVIVTFLRGISPSRPSADQCRKLGAGLARFHGALADFDMTRPNDLSMAAWPKMWAGREAEADVLSAGLSGLIAGDMGALEGAWPTASDALPVGAIHADLFPDNVFFLDGELSGVFDFYFACTDFLAYDLAVCLNAWCFETRGEYNLTKGRALIQGYHSVRQLTEAERTHLPGLARGAALRFFLTRLIDWTGTPKDALVRPKNPMEYAEKLGFHRRARVIGEYGG